MNTIPTKIHGLFDYLIAVWLLLMPWVFGYDGLGGMGTLLPLTLGASIIAYSLVTDYEWGVFKLIDLRAHLIFDGLVGLVLLMSWAYLGFFDLTLWLPYLATAIVVLLGAALTARPPLASPLTGPGR